MPPRFALGVPAGAGRVSHTWKCGSRMRRSEGKAGVDGDGDA